MSMREATQAESWGGQGLSTEPLEQGVVAELLEALEAQEMAEWDPEAAQRKGYFDRARELRRASVAKAKGGAA